MIAFFVIWSMSAIISSGHRHQDNLQVVYEWKTMEFAFPSEAAKQNLIARGNYVPGTNTLPLDVDVWYGGAQRFVFLTFPKFRSGVPATLGTVSDGTRYGNSPLVQPFPDWSWHTQKNCQGMTSVFRTQIDKCGRLWAIDSGMVDLFLPTRRRECQPKILVFNLQNKSLLSQHSFPETVLESNSLLTNIVVELVHNDCGNAFAYVSDTTSPALLVVDMRNNKSWRVISNSMYPYPPYGKFLTNDIEFNLMDGILGMALTPDNHGERFLYYHSLASLRESWVPTSVLRSEESFKSLQSPAYEYFKTSGQARIAQSLTEAFDKRGILYFGMLDNSLNSWNHRHPFERENIHQIAQDDTKLQFSSGLKVIENFRHEEELWVVTNRFQIIMVGDYNPEEINFRIVKGSIPDLTINCKCHDTGVISFPNRTAQHEKRPFEIHINKNNHKYGIFPRH